MRISTKRLDADALAKLSRRDALGCLRTALGVLAGIVGFIFLTTVGSAVNAWIHRDGYRPTDVVFYSITRGAAKISIVPTGENVYQSKSKLDFEFEEGPRTVLYNPDARTTFAGVTLLDDRIIVRMDRDFQSEAILITSGAIASFSAAWLLLGLHKRGPKRRRRV